MVPGPRLSLFPSSASWSNSAANCIPRGLSLGLSLDYHSCYHNISAEPRKFPEMSRIATLTTTTVTTTTAPPPRASGTVILQAPPIHVQWDSNVIDNENMGKRKSKRESVADSGLPRPPLRPFVHLSPCLRLSPCASSPLAGCCIYHKPKKWDESSSDSSDDDEDDEDDEDKSSGGGGLPFPVPGDALGKTGGEVNHSGDASAPDGSVAGTGAPAATASRRKAKPRKRRKGAGKSSKARAEGESGEAAEADVAAAPAAFQMELDPENCDHCAYLARLIDLKRQEEAAGAAAAAAGTGAPANSASPAGTA